MAAEQYSISLGVILNLGDIKTQISGIQSQVTPIKINFDLAHTQSQIDAIKTQIRSLNDVKVNLGAGTGSGGATGGLQRTSNELQKIQALARQIGNLDFKLGKLDTRTSVNQVRELERQLKLLKTQYTQTANALSQKGITGISSATTKEFVNARNKLAEFDAKLADTKAKLANGIQLKLNDGTFTNDISNIETRFRSLSTKSDEVRVRIDQVRQALTAMRAASTSGDTEALISANERYTVALKRVENQLRINARAEQEVNNLTALNQAKQNLSLKMSNWLKNNSAAAKKFGAEIQNLQVQLNGCGNMVGVNQVGQAFQNVALRAKEAGVATQSFGARLKKQFASYSAYFSAASVFMYGIMAIRSMFNQVKEIDSAMTELKKVTDETAESYDRFLSNAATRSKEIGTTISGLVDSTADFARLGYSFEDAQGLAEVANIYAVVGDEVEGVEGATKSLISTMAAFKDQADGMSNTDFAMDIIDKFNEIGKLIA